MSFLNEDSPYWRWCDDSDMFLRGYLESCDCTDKKPDIEKILLNRLESEKKGCRCNAREKLVQIYGTGKYLFNDGETAVDIEGFPNIERLGDFVNDNIEHENDVDNIIYCKGVTDMDKIKIVLNYEQTQIVESENEKYKRIKFYSVITEENEEIYLVSEDRKDLILDVKKALAYAPRRRPLRHFQYDKVILHLC